LFDPTAFDNMKVLIEGILYDKDLAEELVITDRNDLINISKMNRKFSIQFNHINKNSSCKFTLETTAKDLYSELLNGDTKVGCNVELEFYLSNELAIEVLQRSMILLQNNTNEQFTVISNIKQPLFDKNTKKNSVMINFTNKFTENDFDKLEEILHISEMMLQWYDEQILKEI
jgi:hypothetical protein